MFEVQPAVRAWNVAERRCGRERRQGRERREEIRFDLSKDDRRRGADRRHRGHWLGSTQNRW